MNKKGICYVSAAAIIFGLMPICAKTIYASGGNPWFLSFLRFALALPLLAVGAAAEQKGKPHICLDKTARKNLLILSAGLTATPIFLFWSYSYISSALSTTVHFVYPLFVFLLCMVFFRQKADSTQIICCILCMLGVVLFYTPNDTSSVFGIILSLFSGLTYGGYIVWLSKSKIQEVLDGYQLLLYLQSIGAIVLLIINICLGTLHWEMSLNAWLLSALFGGGITAATFLFQKGTKLCGPQYASFLSVLEPATSTVAGALLLNESLKIRMCIGIVCVLVSTVLIANKKETM